MYASRAAGEMPPESRYLDFCEAKGGHEVPGAKNKKDLIQSANAIKRMLSSL